MLEWIKWTVAIFGALEAIDGIASGFARTRSVLRWLKLRGAYLIAPWGVPKKVAETRGELQTNVAALRQDMQSMSEDIVTQIGTIARRVAEWEARNPRGEHFKGARWVRIEREASNVPFCERCYQESGLQQLHRMSLAPHSKVDAPEVVLNCSGNDRHHLRMDSKSYLWARDVMSITRD